MTDMTVAKTILAQLGGSRFVAMTGARHMAGDATSLSFGLPRFPGVKVNKVKIGTTAFTTTCSRTSSPAPPGLRPDFRETDR